MITVYAIYGKDYDIIYVGLTNNLERRISEHKRGHNKSTKRFKDITLLYTKIFDNYKSARKEEKRLKAGQGKRFLRTLIDN